MVCISNNMERATPHFTKRIDLLIVHDPVSLSGSIKQECVCVANGIRLRSSVYIFSDERHLVELHMKISRCEEEKIILVKDMESSL